MPPANAAEEIISSLPQDRRRLLEARLRAPAGSSTTFASSQGGGTADGAPENPSGLSAASLLAGVELPTPLLAPPSTNSNPVSRSHADTDSDEIEDSVGSFSSASNESIQSGGAKGSARQGRSQKRRKRDATLENFFNRDSVRRAALTRSANNGSVYSGSSSEARPKAARPDAESAAAAEAAAAAAAAAVAEHTAAVAAARECIASHEQTIAHLRAENDRLTASAAASEEHHQRAHADSRLRQQQLVSMLIDTIRTCARAERAECTRRVEDRCERFGRIGVQRTGATLYEAWEDGRELRDIDRQNGNLQKEREEVERQQRELQKTVRKLGSGASGAAGSAPASPSSGAMPPPPPMRPAGTCAASIVTHSQQFVAEQAEVLKLRLVALRRRECELQEARTRAESERDLLMREIKRQRDESASPLNDLRLLNDRYLMTNLLGRGGFSEVFKAFDVKELRWVACKIHQLHSHWSEGKKSNYIRHATREYNIHRSLDHPRVVKLWDVLEIDSNSFCTVLEYCPGSDLDQYLKTHKILPEREARCIISQVFSGLLHLSEQRQRIIHYDLKPGNILLTNGSVKITDFGLSKIMEDDADTKLELTSQGAGTYWYLPPECFEQDGAPPRISSKVDVWSAGVILYQMLFGRRPFGHELSQEHILREGTILRSELAFPSKPQVSDEAKTFIRLCLTRSQAERPDMATICNDPFLRRNLASASAAPKTDR